MNVTDPLSEASRGVSLYEEYFSGTGASGQINYLGRKPATSGKFTVYVGGVAKTSGVDYTLSRSTGRITWINSPASGSDNIYVEYQAVKPWIYDDDPNPGMSKANFPRVSVDEIGNDYQTRELGEYQNYASGHGNLITAQFNIKIRNRHSNEFYTYKSIHYKNMDLLHAISKEITDYINTNRFVMPWLFFDWEVVRSQRRREEEEMDVFRKDILIKVRYFEG